MNKDIEIIEIDDTEIFLDDKGNGQGKITISNTYGFNYSYYWGAMGCSLKEFITKINEDYFVTKLADKPYTFSPRQTAKAVRKYIREELTYELPWYKHMEFQKGLREWIKGMESIETEEWFVDYCFGIMNDHRINFFTLDRWDEDEVRRILENTFTTEPWHFIEKEDSKEAVFLKKLFKKLQTKLKTHE